LLKLERVGPDDNFFLLGGDSLRGVQLIAQVKALFGVELAIQLLFEEGATVAGMARSIEAIRKAETEGLSATVVRRGNLPMPQFLDGKVAPIGPLSHATTRMVSRAARSRQPRL